MILQLLGDNRKKVVYTLDAIRQVMDDTQIIRSIDLNTTHNLVRCGFVNATKDQVTNLSITKHMRRSH